MTRADQCCRCGFVSEEGPLTAHLDGVGPICGRCDFKPWTQPRGHHEPLPEPVDWLTMPGEAETPAQVLYIDEAVKRGGVYLGTLPATPEDLRGATWIGGEGGCSAPGDYVTEPVGRFTWGPDEAPAEASFAGLLDFDNATVTPAELSRPTNEGAVMRRAMDAFLMDVGLEAAGRVGRAAFLAVEPPPPDAVLEVSRYDPVTDTADLTVDGKLVAVTCLDWNITHGSHHLHPGMRYRIDEGPMRGRVVRGTRHGGYDVAWEILP